MRSPLRMLFTSLSHGLARSSGFDTGGPHPPAHILAHLPVTQATRMQCPRACLQGSAHRPSPRCLSRNLAGSSAVPKPELLLELQSGEDMETETGEAAAWPEGSWGS